MKSLPKIALIGAGHIGGTIAHMALLRQMGQVVLLDKIGDFAKGKALDLAQSMASRGESAAISGSGDLKDLEGADVIIVTAGFPRKPGMSRDDLIAKNVEVFQDIAPSIQKYAKGAFIIVVTNPLDVMVWVMQNLTGFPTSHVVGMAGMLDSARFRHFLAEELGISPAEIQTMVLGGHGDLMVPLPSQTTVSGVSLQYFIDQGILTQERLDDIIQRTRQGGGEIVKLLQTGSAFYAPATAALDMAEAYLKDQKRLVPCAAFLEDSYGLKGLYAGVPVIIGKGGVESLLDLPLSDQERQAFQTSTGHVQDLITQTKKLL